MLAYFGPKLQTILETETSGFITAAVLSHYEKSAVLRPVAFRTKKMMQAEFNYSIFDK